MANVARNAPGAPGRRREPGDRRSAKSEVRRGHEYTHPHTERGDRNALAEHHTHADAYADRDPDAIANRYAE